MPFHAPTLADRLWEASGSEGSFSDDAVVQTLHADKQVRSSPARCSPRALCGDDQRRDAVIDAETGAVRARVGSSGYFKDREGARLDLSRALRPPARRSSGNLRARGGLAHPATWLPDDQRNFGLPARELLPSRRGRVQAYAAQQSLNPPAIALLQALGQSARSKPSARRDPPGQREPGSVGLSLALGGVSLRMEDLAALFTAFATDGAVRPLCETPKQCATSPQPFVGPRSAAQVTAILADSPQPLLTDAEDLPRVAFKTGTSARHAMPGPSVATVST